MRQGMCPFLKGLALELVPYIELIARYIRAVAINKGSICREAKIPEEGAAHLGNTLV